MHLGVYSFFHCSTLVVWAYVEMLVSAPLDGFYGWLFWMASMAGFSGWLLWMASMDDFPGWLPSLEIHTSHVTCSISFEGFFSSFRDIRRSMHCTDNCRWL
jgi:hypothetical protein